MPMPPKKLRLIEEQQDAAPYAELIEQLATLTPIRARKAQKAQQALIEAQQVASQLLAKQ